MKKGIQGNISPGIESTPGRRVDSTDYVRQNPMFAIPVDSSPQRRKIFSGGIPSDKHIAFEDRLLVVSQHTGPEHAVSGLDVAVAVIDADDFYIVF